jgi:spermidine synthase
MKSQKGSVIPVGMLLLLAFTEGAAVMVLELIGGRMIAPVYGSCLVVWTTVLGVTMTGLALGYMWGGNMASKSNSSGKMCSLFIAGAFLILVMPKIAAFSIDVFDPDALFISTLLSSFLFLFLPVTLLGTTTPILVKLLTDYNTGQGRASGKIYGASTIGGILFTFLVGFWLVPEHGLSVTALITAIGVCILPTIILMKLKGFKYGLIIMVCIILGATIDIPKTKPTGVKILHQSEGLLGQLLLVDQPRDNKNTDRILFVNRMGQTWVDKKTGNSIWSYPNYITVLASSLKEKPDVLILGIGGGTLARMLKNLLDANVETVDLDERIGKIAKQYFNLPGNVKINIDDARHFIRTNNKKYDLIIFDVFKGEIPPAHVLTVECFKDAAKNLNKDGLIVVNFNGFVNGEKGDAGRAVIKTIQAAGYNINIFPTVGSEEERNNLYVASLTNKTFKETRIKLNLFNQEALIDTMQLSLESIPFTPEDKPLTDDFPVLELLNLEASKAWRKEYNDNYTQKYSEKGVPFFR